MTPTGATRSMAMPPVSAVALPDDRVQIRSPRPRLLRLPLPGQEVQERDARPDLVDRGQPFAEQAVPSQLEQADRALGRYVDVTHLVVAAPDLHVGRVGRVAGVHLVVEDDAGEVVPDQRCAYPPEAVAAHVVEVARCVGMLHRAVLARARRIAVHVGVCGLALAAGSRRFDGARRQFIQETL